MKTGDKVVFKIDIRGFLAWYIIKEIKDGKALLDRGHLWPYDGCLNTWQPLEKLRHYGE